MVYCAWLTLGFVCNRNHVICFPLKTLPNKTPPLWLQGIWLYVDKLCCHWRVCSSYVQRLTQDTCTVGSWALGMQALCFYCLKCMTKPTIAWTCLEQYNSWQLSCAIFFCVATSLLSEIRLLTSHFIACTTHSSLYCLHQNTTNMHTSEQPSLQCTPNVTSCI